MVEKNQLNGYFWGLRTRDQLGRKQKELFWSSYNVPCLSEVRVTEVCALVKAHAKVQLRFVHFFIC